jgi:indole-3-glycerol phosphate synthase
VSILDDILVAKRRRLEVRRSLNSIQSIRQSAAEAPSAVDFVEALRQRDHVRLIAEIKRASPSKGPLNLGLDHRAQARLYADNGVAGISVLCEEDFFLGGLNDLKEVREELAGAPIPVLCKDFLTEPFEIYEARATGADTVLLIMTMLDEARARELLETARSVGMEPLVEVHDEADVEKALAIGARVIGVNNRDLRTFVTDLAVTERLAPTILAAGVPVLISESGIVTPDHVRRVAASGATAILVGESIVTSPNPQQTLQSLTTIPRP